MPSITAGGKGAMTSVAAMDSARFRQSLATGKGAQRSLAWFLLAV